MPDTGPAPIEVVRIPIDAIDIDAFPRDRAALDEERLTELVNSIATGGLRTPIDVCELEGEPGAPQRYALISGYRRLLAYPRGCVGQDPSTIPAVVRGLHERNQALRFMAEENYVRADVSPWERAGFVADAVARGFYETHERAIDNLFMLMDRHRRWRMRSIAMLFYELDGILVAPERYTERQLLRLAGPMFAGYDKNIEWALKASRDGGPEAQWAAILPCLEEYEAERRAPPAAPSRPGRPRRAVVLRDQLAVRRERTREGYVLRFSGPEATSELLDLVLDEIERKLTPPAKRSQHY